MRNQLSVRVIHPAKTRDMFCVDIIHVLTISQTNWRK